VSIEVWDSSGALVRRVSSIDPAAFTPEQLQRALIPAYWIRMTPPLETGAGMHRWVWDLHYAPPRSTQRGFPISAVPGDTPLEPAGPTAPPGSYRVRLTLGKQRWETELTVAADPRVKITAADYAAQFALARRLADLLDGSTGALLEAQSVRAQLKALTPPQGAPLAERIKALDAHLGALLDSADPGDPAQRGLEKLNGDVATLYTEVAGVDAAPTRVQAVQTDLALAEWHGLDSARERLREEIAALNRELHKAKLPPLRTELAPPRDVDFADDD
jgi:hypothetical protein